MGRVRVACVWALVALGGGVVPLAQAAAAANTPPSRTYGRPPGAGTAPALTRAEPAGRLDRRLGRGRAGRHRLQADGLHLPVLLADRGARQRPVRPRGHPPVAGPVDVGRRAVRPGQQLGAAGLDALAVDEL